uniref:GTPase HflX n=1 Tax=uncultured Acidobacteriota bacterium TaxID=171953 RepID=H5S9D5_9BACT|nr:GTP-binding protein HflX [uncultured Acidobacteriota bacterium]
MERLYHRRLPPDQIITPELARTLAELSHEMHRQVGILVDRKGRIEYVVVGDARQIVWPDLRRVRTSSGRFCGLRCIHTHLNGESFTEDDLTDLALLRLDVMAIVEVTETGIPARVHVAHLMPAQPGDADGGSTSFASRFQLLEPQPPGHLSVNFLELIESLEEELARNRRLAHPQDERERALLVSVTTGSLAEAEESLEELRQLSDSAGVVVLDAFVQRRKAYDPKFLIGKGKLREVLTRALQLGADMIIFDQSLTPGQVRAINAATDLKILDRPQLILDIFAQRARSREGKLQVELAQLRYLLPRLTDADTGLSRLTGGIGGRGPGETKLEMDRRRIRERIRHLEEQIAALRTEREQRRQRRRRAQIPVVSIVGYTNAGKSTLLNTLTRSCVLAEERMFATLDPTSRRLRLPQGREIILSDTVGFIRHLPPDVLRAFRATLEEIADSDLLIHLVDASSPHIERHIETVEATLRELHLGQIPRLLVFNKSDLVAPEIVRNLCRSYGALAISALHAETLGELLERIAEQLGGCGGADEPFGETLVGVRA